MATEFCQKCKKAHPGRVCDYDDKGECAETADSNEVAKPSGEASGDDVGGSPAEVPHQENREEPWVGLP